MPRETTGFAHIFLLIVILIVIVLAATITFGVVRSSQQHQKAVQNERALYAKLDSEAQSYIQAINQKYPGTVKHESTCSYSSVEFGHGYLGCNVGASITYDSLDDQKTLNLINYLKEKVSLLGWGSYTISKSYTGQDSDPRNTDLLFKTVPDCSVSYYFSSNTFLVVANCGGSALAEYYPVVGN